MAADVLAVGDQLALRPEQGSGVETAGPLKDFLLAAQPAGEGRQTGRVDGWARRQRLVVDGETFHGRGPTDAAGGAAEEAALGAASATGTEANIDLVRFQE